jgi:HAD superfamily hydrolase (TIGR01490 family)
MRLILFDIDGTLVPGRGSEPRFAAHLWRHGRLGPHQLGGYAYYALRYLPRYRRHILQKNKAYLAGLTVVDVCAWAQDFVANKLRPRLYPPAVARLRVHVEAGDYVVLLSGTPDFIAAPLACALNARGSCGALCATAGGVFLAKPPLRHPYGPDKVAAARKIASEAGLSLDRAVAYGDSINDAPLFHAVGSSVVVMPDRRLRAAACDENWELMR